MIRRPAVAAAALALALALAGCGSSDNGPGENARATVETLLESCSRADTEAVLHLLTEAARERFVGAGSTVEGCRRVLAPGFSRPLPESLLEWRFRETRVTGVQTNAGFATVRLQTGSGERTEVELELLHGAWNVANSPRPA